MLPNEAQVLSVARAVLLIIGTGLTTYGAASGINESMWETITGGVLMIVPVVWSMFAHTKTNTITAAAKLPEVAQIVATPAFASKIPDPKVVDARQRPA